MKKRDIRIDINLSMRKRPKRAFFSVIAVALSLMAVIWAWWNIDTYLMNSSHLKGIDEHRALLESLPKKKALSEDASNLKTLKRDVDFINSVIQKKAFSWTGLFGDLEASVPPNIYLTQISPDFGADKVTVIGVAESVSDALAMVEAMGRSQRFKDVFLLKHSEEKEKRARTVVFTLSAGYRADR